VLPADITDRAAIEAAIAQAAQCLGGIDVLVPCAAGLAYGGFADLRPEDFDRSHDVTFRGAVNTIRAGLPELERSGGTLVAVVSMASKIGVPPSGIARRRLHRAPGVHRDALLRSRDERRRHEAQSRGAPCTAPRTSRRRSPSAHGIPARRSTSGAAPRRRACSRWCPGP
jgi:NAD(P)-dependent dehydrogenase (short-subunit alcohol dehydrogenase family)